MQGSSKNADTGRSPAHEESKEIYDCQKIINYSLTAAGILSGAHFF